MTSALIILKSPENGALAIEERLSSVFPAVRFNSVETPEAAASYLGECEVLITLGVHLGEQAAGVFRDAPALRWVQVIGTGVDNVKDHPALSPEVAITNVAGVHGPQMSEAAFAAMLGFARDTPRLVRNQSAARWERFAARLLFGKTVGILGLGAIAEALAPRCRSFGMRVVGFSASNRGAAGFDVVHASDSLSAHAGELDYLVVLTPLTPRTHGLVGRAVLAAMRPDAVLVNLARGGVVDEVGLLDALRARAIRGAALDVFAIEPLPAESPFWHMDNVMITPHVGGLHDGYADQVAELITDNLHRYLEGGPAALRNRV